MATVYVEFKEEQTKLLWGLKYCNDKKRAAVELNLLLTLPNTDWPPVERVYLLHGVVDWPVSPGVYQVGGTRMAVDADGGLTSVGKSVRNFIRAHRLMKNGNFRNNYRRS